MTQSTTELRQAQTSRRDLLRVAGIGSAVAIGSGLFAGGDPASASTGSSDAFVNVKDHGARGDGSADDFTAITDAINTADANGGGIVFFPPGTYRISAQLNLGDGSDSAVSTKHHRISLVGSGKGGSPSLNFVENIGATEIIYDGDADVSAAVLSLEGPLHSVSVENLVLNANLKAGFGIRINHVTDSYFCALMTRQATAAGWILTSRNGFPPGCVYGCGNNVLIHCWSYDPGPSSHGIVFTSGVSNSKSLTGNPDAANNDVIGGCFFYPGSSGTAGFYFAGADNNTVYGAQAIPSGGSGGHSVYFEPWEGDTRFPLENAFYNIGMSQSIGGTSGSLGNTFTIFQNGDGASLPELPYINASTHLGVQVVFGKRAYRVRQVQKLSVSSPVSTTSTSFTDAAGLNMSLESLVPGSSKLRVSFTGVLAKAKNGSGEVVIALDGVPVGETRQVVAATASPVNGACETILETTAGSHKLSVQLRSTNDKAATIESGALLIEELY